jgi:hypothetical protein
VAEGAIGSSCWQDENPSSYLQVTTLRWDATVFVLQIVVVEVFNTGRLEIDTKLSKFTQGTFARQFGLEPFTRGVTGCLRLSVKRIVAKYVGMGYVIE